MERDLSSRPFQLKIVAITLFVVFFALAHVSGLKLESSQGNAVVSVEEKIRSGNLGTTSIYEVKLRNGSRFSYSKYRSHHPLCPDQPEKCGEDSKDRGWDEVDDMIPGDEFNQSGETTYRAVEDVCMVSRTSFEAC